MAKRRATHTSNINVRLSPDELDYLNGMADRLDVSLSEAVRAAIARSWLHEQITEEIPAALDADGLPLPDFVLRARNVRADELDED